MRILTILALLLLASPVYAQLTKEDLRTIIKEENAVLEKRMKEYIDAVNTRIDALEKSVDGRFEAVDGRFEALNTRFEALNARMDDIDSKFNRIWLAIIALITAAIALPQLIIIYAERKRGREIQMLLEQLRDKTEGTETGTNQ